MQSEPASKPLEAVSAPQADGLAAHLAPAVPRAPDAPPLADTLPPEAHIPPPEPLPFRAASSSPEAGRTAWHTRFVQFSADVALTARDRFFETGRRTFGRVFSRAPRPSGAEEATNPPRAQQAAAMGLVALAAAVGIAGGALGHAGITRWWDAETPASAANAGLANEVKAMKEALNALRGNVRTLADQVAGLRGSVEAAGKASNAAYAKVQDHLGKLHDDIVKLQENDRPRPSRQASGPQHFPTTLDRAAAALERHSPPATDVTGSVPTPAPRPPESAPPKPNVVEGWTLRRVYDGAALIEGSRGLVEVIPGDVVRGLGRIHEIRREDGRWMVVTSRGLIVSR